MKRKKAFLPIVVDPVTGLPTIDVQSVACKMCKGARGFCRKPGQEGHLEKCTCKPRKRIRKIRPKGPDGLPVQRAGQVQYAASAPAAEFAFAQQNPPQLYAHALNAPLVHLDANGLPLPQIDKSVAACKLCKGARGFCRKPGMGGGHLAVCSAKATKRVRRRAGKSGAAGAAAMPYAYAPTAVLVGSNGAAYGSAIHGIPIHAAPVAVALAAAGSTAAGIHRDAGGDKLYI